MLFLISKSGSLFLKVSDLHKPFYSYYKESMQNPNFEVSSLLRPYKQTLSIPFPLCILDSIGPRLNSYPFPIVDKELLSVKHRCFPPAIFLFDFASDSS